MAQKVELEVEVPEGYKLLRVGRASSNTDLVLYAGEVRLAVSVPESARDFCVIVSKGEPAPELISKQLQAIKQRFSDIGVEMSNIGLGSDAQRVYQLLQRSIQQAVQLTDQLVALTSLVNPPLDKETLKLSGDHYERVSEWHAKLSSNQGLTIGQQYDLVSEVVALSHIVRQLTKYLV